MNSIEEVTPRGLRVKTVDSVTLPRAFSTLQTAELIVDSGASGNFLLQFAAFRRLMRRYQSTAAKIARTIGRSEGVVRFEVSTMIRRKDETFRGRKSYMLAVLPAIQAATAIAAGRFPQRGIVPPTEHVDAAHLLAAITKEGITIT